jgi:hypothetical protein
MQWKLSIMWEANFRVVCQSHSGFQGQESETHGIVVKWFCACNGLFETGAEAGFSSYRDVCWPWPKWREKQEAINQGSTGRSKWTYQFGSLTLLVPKDELLLYFLRIEITSSQNLKVGICQFINTPIIDYIDIFIICRILFMFSSLIYEVHLWCLSTTLVTSGFFCCIDFYVVESTMAFSFWLPLFAYSCTQPNSSNKLIVDCLQAKRRRWAMETWYVLWRSWRWSSRPMYPSSFLLPSCLIGLKYLVMEFSTKTNWKSLFFAQFIKTWTWPFVCT